MLFNISTAKFLTPVLVLFAFLVGPVGAAAPKGLVVLLLACGGAGLIHWFSSGRPATLVPRFLAVIASILFLWALLTAFWAPGGWWALSLSMKLAALSGVGLGLVYGIGTLDESSRYRVGSALLWGVGMGVSILGVGYVYAMATGNSLWGNYDFDPLTTMNNGAVSMSLLLWPAAAILWGRERRLGAFLFLVAFVGFLFLFSSGAALLGTGAGLFAFALNAVFGRRGGIAIAFVMAVMVVSAPFAVSQIPEVKKVVSALPGLAPSAQHRLHMWKFVVERIEEKKMLGWGMNASRSIPQESSRLAPNMEIMPLHPHNGPLQIRLELGLPGAGLAAVLIFYVFFPRVWGLPNRLGAGFRAAVATGYITVGAVSFGVWQNWWIAMAWCLAALIGLATSVMPASDRTKPLG